LTSLSDVRTFSGDFIARSEPGMRNDYITFMLVRDKHTEYKKIIVHDEYNEIMKGSILKANEDVQIDEKIPDQQQNDVSDKS